MFKSVPDVGRAGLQCEAWWELSLYSRKGQPSSSLNLRDQGYGKLALCGLLGKGHGQGFRVWGWADRVGVGAGSRQGPSRLCVPATRRALCMRQDEARQVLRGRVSGAHPALMKC